MSEEQAPEIISPTSHEQTVASEDFLEPTSPAFAFEEEITASDTIADGTQVLAHDGYDVQEFDDAVETYSRLGRTVEAADQKLVTAPALLRDLFWSFHKRAPRIDPVVPLSPAHGINQQIMEEIMSTAEWKELRETGTIGDALTSAMATIGASEKAIAALGPKTIERINQLQEAAGAAEHLFDQAEALEELASRADEEKAAALFKQAEQARALAQQNQEQAEEVAAELEQTHEEWEKTVRQAARQGLAEALEQIESTHYAIKAFSGGYSAGYGTGPGGGGSSELTVKEKISLAERIGKSKKLQMIAAMCGRFTRIALQQQKSRVKHPPDEITSITTGNDIGRLLPCEIALLADPQLEDLFFYKFATKQLLQYDLIGHEPEGQGPIIVAIDESGSMLDPLPGPINSSGSPLCGLTKEVWAKSVLLALLAIARLQKRDFAVIHFSAFDDQRKPQLTIHRFPQGQGSPAEVIACAEFFYGGGTLFEPWMSEAMRLVDEARFDKADVIIISDGLTSIEPKAQDDWQKRRAERGMRAYGILIGTNEGAEPLGRITDAMLPLDDLQDEMNALKTVFSI